MPESAKRNVLVLLGYSAVSFAYFGARLLPHPGRVLVGQGQDPQIFVWSFAWWPHALGHGTNPLVSHAIYATDGYNLAWTTSVPAIAVAFTPLTVLFGPVVSFNAAAILLPALAAWTAFLLCRSLTASTWASLVGGYLFGFSSYVLGQQLQAHLHVTGVFLVPLVVLVLVRFLRGGLDRRGLAWRLGALLGLQLWISTEVALTLTLALAAGLALGFWRMRATRPRLRSALAPIAAGYGIGLLVAAPLLVYALLGLPDRSFTAPESGTSDAVNLVSGTEVTALGVGSWTRGLNTTESALYLGLPTLAIVAWFGWRERRSRPAQVLVLALVLALAAALGATLRVHGHDLVTLPWSAAHHVPGLENARLPRLALYASLAAAIAVALWTATTRGRFFPRPFVLPVLAVVALMPALDEPMYVGQHGRVPFFTDGLYRSCLGPGENVAVFPYGHAGDSMLWQAESGFGFRLAGGYLYPLVHDGPSLTSFDDDPTVEALNFRSDTARPRMTSLLALAGSHGIDRIVAVDGAGYPSERQLRALGPVQRIGGVLVAPACGSAPLTSRNLDRYVEEAATGATITYCLDGNFYALPAGLYPAGLIARATPAPFVAGAGLTCAVPAGYRRHGFATAANGVRPQTYPYYAP